MKRGLLKIEEEAIGVGSIEGNEWYQYTSASFTGNKYYREARSKYWKDGLLNKINFCQ